MNKFLLFIVFLLIVFFNDPVYGSSGTAVLSPDGNIEISFKLDDNGKPLYSIRYGSTVFLGWSGMGLSFLEGGSLNEGLMIINIESTTIDETYEIVAGKSKYSHNFCNQTKIQLQETRGRKRKIDIYLRAYNDGAAFRYGLPVQTTMNEFRITAENTDFNFGGDYTCWAMKKSGFKHSSEGEYQKLNFSRISVDAPDPVITLPLTIKVNNDLFLCLSEANITDYPGMSIIKQGVNSFKSALSPDVSDPSISVIGKPPAVSPWRVFIIGRSPGTLIESNLIMNLNEPSKITDHSWIKPGKSLWSWWAEDKGFEPEFGYGMILTNTIKYYIDFAAMNSIEYVIIDAGWYGWDISESIMHDLTKPLPECDLPYLAEYSKSTGVGLIVWVLWNELDAQMDKALDYYSALGIKGIKVDFMDRDDQKMIDFYHRVAEKCAERKLVVIFHGSYKPDGLNRTYPNLLTREGILGNEYAKWDPKFPNPVHNVTIPFTRMIAGAMDYTPGSMTNTTLQKYKNLTHEPMTLGTRAQQMAMLVVYESGIQALCESPKIYENLPEFEFIRQVPAAWDSTIYLGGSIGEYIILARKKNDIWFIGGMTDWKERDLTVDLSFLADVEYEAEIWQDAKDANIIPSNTEYLKTGVTGSERKTIHLAKGGGFVIVLKEQ
jgi:alpha-glucosidase